MYKTSVVFLCSIVQLAVANAPRKRQIQNSPEKFSREGLSPRRTVDGGGILHEGNEPSTVRVQRAPDHLGSRLSAMEVSAEGASKAILRGQDGPAHLALEIGPDGVPLQSGVVGSSPSQRPGDVHIMSAGQKDRSQSRATNNQKVASASVTVPPVTAVTSTKKIAEGPPTLKKFNAHHLAQLKKWGEQEKVNSFISPVNMDDSSKDESMSSTIGHILDGLSGGTGTVMEPTHNLELDREIRFRMRMQDIAVLALLLVIYMAILFFMYSLIYRMSNSDSSVKFYCDPSYHRLTCQSADVDSFIAAFNKRPETNKPQIRVAGFAESENPAQQSGISAWRGKNYKTSFYYALDLDTWMDSEGIVDEKELRTIEEFIQTTNPLATISIRKEMVWKDFEEVATNLKAKIRACGFEGPLDVSMSPPDTCRVFQNTRWANFMYNETVKVMTLLSIVGGLVYLPYMWVRSRRERKVVTSKFNINISGKDYWELISPHISEHGFGLPQGETPSAPQLRPNAGQASPNRDPLAERPLAANALINSINSPYVN